MRQRCSVIQELIVRAAEVTCTICGDKGHVAQLRSIVAFLRGVRRGFNGGLHSMVSSVPCAIKQDCALQQTQLSDYPYIPFQNHPLVSASSESQVRL